MSDLMILSSWVCADSYFWKYLASLLPPGMNPRILRPTPRSAWFGVRSSTVLRRSPSVVATLICALSPERFAPATEVDERDGGRVGIGGHAVLLEVGGCRWEGSVGRSAVRPGAGHAGHERRMFVAGGPISGG
jgi:hypothetical protein